MLVTKATDTHELVIGVLERQPNMVVPFLKDHEPSFGVLLTIYRCTNCDWEAEVAKLLFQIPVRPEWNEGELDKELKQVRKRILNTYGQTSYYSSSEEHNRKRRRDSLEKIEALIKPCLNDLKEKRLSERIDRLEPDQLLQLIRQGKETLIDDEWQRAVERAAQFFAGYGPGALINRLEEENSTEVRRIIRESLVPRLGTCSADLLVVLLPKTAFRELVPEILAALEQQGYATTQFLELRKTYPAHSEAILGTITERADLPFEIVLEKFKNLTSYVGRGDAQKTLKAVLPNLTEDQIRMIKPFFVLWNEGYAFKRLVAGHARNEVAISFCIQENYFPEALVERQDVSYEEILAAYRQTSPDNDNGWFARRIVEQFSPSKRAAKVA